MLKDEELTHEILRCAYEVHSELGPGLLEKPYEIALEYELIKAGFKVERQKAQHVEYKGVELDVGYRMDLVVEGSVIIEIKSVEDFHPRHEAQMLTYLRLSGMQVGLWLNFNTTSLKKGIRRYVMD